MMKTLRFRFNSEKFVNAVAYLALACPSSTKLSICKLLYFADKEHLLRYGRPILGDHYYNLEHGPVPTRGLDMLRHKASAEEQALLEKYVAVIGNSVHPKRPANRKVFSKSDLLILDEVIAKYGHLPPFELISKTHAEPPWLKSQRGCPIDYELFFKGRPEAAEMKEIVQREQETRDLVSRYHAQR
jgi:uncharacterized phage-associated protein